MRVPVYPQDLIRNRGFKSLSKQLQQQWCGPTAISLATAQKALAQGLGYQSFHDLEKSSKTCPPNEPLPLEADIRQAIRSAIEATLLPETEQSVDQGALERLINDLSLKKLAAFKRVQVSSIAGRSPLLKWISVPKPELTKEYVQTLEQILNDSGSLRDRALFACMLGALRPSEFLSAKIQNGAAVYGVKSLDTKKVLDAIPDRDRSILEQHIKTSKLSEGDYLFRANNAPGRPLSSDALRRICVSWALKANIDEGLLTPHSLRKTTDDYADLMRKISERMGHHSANSSWAYAPKLPTTRIH